MLSTIQNLILLTVLASITTCWSKAQTCPPAGVSVLSFDGIDDVVAIPYSPLLPTTQFTIAAWIKLPPVSVMNGFPSQGAVIAAWGEDSLDRSPWWMWVSRELQYLGRLVLSVEASDGASTHVRSLAVVADGQWHHVAATRDSTGAMRVYIDGQQDGFTAMSVTPTSAPQQQMTVGAMPISQGPQPPSSCCSWHLQGLVSQVTLWGQALSSAQVSQLSCSLPIAGAPGLVGSWNFFTGMGLVAIDSSNNGLNGSLGLGLPQTRPTWVTSAAVTVAGTGCVAVGGQPSLAASLPVLGQSLSLTVVNAATSASGFLFIGTASPAPLVLPSGCEVYLDIASLQPFLPIATDVAGGWSVSIPLPSIAMLAGASASLQAAVFPASSLIGIDLTNAVTLVLGF